MPKPHSQPSPGPSRSSVWDRTVPTTFRAAAAFTFVYAAVAVPAIVAFQPPSANLAASVLLGAVLIALSCIDAETLRLPDSLTLSLAAIGIVMSGVLRWDDPAGRLLAAAFGYGTLYLVAASYRHVRGRPGLGLGDAKLFAAAGAWLGFEGLPSVLLIASLLALAFAVAARLRGADITAETRIPFGPYLAYGFWLIWLFGPMTIG